MIIEQKHVTLIELTIPHNFQKACSGLWKVKQKRKHMSNCLSVPETNGYAAILYCKLFYEVYYLNSIFSFYMIFVSLFDLLLPSTYHKTPATLLAS